MQIISSKYLKFLILLAILIISFWRSPFIFLNGRFVGEEATQHFLFALDNSFFANLFYYDSFAGYFNLVPNLLIEFATKIPLELAPFVTVYGSFIIIILLPYMCLFRDSELLDNDYKKIIASFILFLSPPFVAEIWVNSLNLQIYFCLISILIIFMKNLKKSEKIINHALIFTGSLSGIYTCTLIPLYLLKFLFNRSKYNLTNLLILLTANILQFFLIVKSKTSNALHGSVLTNDFNFDILINFVYNVFAKAIFARQLTHSIWDKLYFFHENYLLFFLVIIIILITLTLYFRKKIYDFIKKDSVLIYLISIFFIISSVIIVGSLENQVGGRYVVISSSIIILILLHVSFKVQKKFLKIFFFTLLSLSIFTGMYEFRPPTKNVKHQYIKYLDCIDCPIWKNEVKKWRKDNSYVIGIWPYPKKNLTLESRIVN